MTPGESISRGTTFRALILIALTLAAFRHSVLDVAATAMHEPEGLHIWAASLLIACLMMKRRQWLRAAAGPGTMAGLILILASLAVLAMGTLAWFPEYVSRAAIVPALAGAIAVAAGWRAVALCLPMLALVLLTIPPGSRYLPFFIVHDDSYSPALLRQALAVIPGTSGEFAVNDFLAARTSEAMLLFGTLSMAVFAGAIAARGRRSLIALTILALPAAAVLHALRTIAWAALEARGWSGEGWLSARALTVAAGLLIAFGFFLLVARFMRIMPAETPAKPGEHA